MHYKLYFDFTPKFCDKTLQIISVVLYLSAVCGYMYIIICVRTSSFLYEFVCLLYDESLLTLLIGYITKVIKNTSILVEHREESVVVKLIKHSQGYRQAVVIK